jgi:hypothetical protein
MSGAKIGGRGLEGKGFGRGGEDRDCCLKKRFAAVIMQDR